MTCNGYCRERCGIIYVEDGSEKIVYQSSLSTLV